MESKICLNCGIEFFKKETTSNKDWNKQKYCSPECFHKKRIGKKASKETKLLMSLNRKGKKKKPFTQEHIKNMSLSQKGKPKSEIAKLNMSISSKGICKSPKTTFKKGHIPWNKIGKIGITPENIKIRTSLEYRLFRKYCFERDNFTCQISGQFGGDLVVHHINNFADFPELRLAIDNGITMSKELHLDFHKKYGKHNNTREQLEEFIQNYSGKIIETY